MNHTLQTNVGDKEKHRESKFGVTLSPINPRGSNLFLFLNMTSMHFDALEVIFNVLTNALHCDVFIHIVHFCSLSRSYIHKNYSANVLIFKININ